MIEQYRDDETQLRSPRLEVVKPDDAEVGTSLDDEKPALPDKRVRRATARVAIRQTKATGAGHKKPTDDLDDLAFPELDTTGQYLREISRQRLLNAEEEVFLAKTIEAGIFAEEALERADELDDQMRRDLGILMREGKAAKERMLTANLRLVVSIARRYAGGRHSMTLLDLIQEGNLGLDRAVQKFEYKKEYKFSTYATWWIKQSVMRSIGNQDAMVRRPVRKGELDRKIFMTQQQFERRTGRVPTDQELSEQLGFDVAAHRDELRPFQNILSLNMALNEDGTAELGDLFASTSDDEKHARILNAIVNGQEHEGIYEIMEKEGLTEREADIIYLRLCLPEDQQLTLEKLGKSGTSHENESGKSKEVRLKNYETHPC